MWEIRFYIFTDMTKLSDLKEVIFPRCISLLKENPHPKWQQQAWSLFVLSPKRPSFLLPCCCTMSGRKYPCFLPCMVKWVEINTRHKKSGQATALRKSRRGGHRRGKKGGLLASMLDGSGLEGGAGEGEGANGSRHSNRVGHLLSNLCRYCAGRKSAWSYKST